jgi:hypothetical protein
MIEVLTVGNRIFTITAGTHAKLKGSDLLAWFGINNSSLNHNALLQWQQNMI